MFPDLPRTGIFDPEETISYFKQIRDKMLTEPTVSQLGSSLGFSRPRDLLNAPYGPALER